MTTEVSLETVSLIERTTQNEYELKTRSHPRHFRSRIQSFSTSHDPVKYGVQASLNEETNRLPTLGVNIDHIATIRQARRTTEPDPVAAAVLAELGGADGITTHLREDRRHIQDRDVYLLRQTVSTHLNLEMAATDEMLKIALDLKPDYVTLVPERREEVTTEGGLDVAGQCDRLTEIVGQLQAAGIPVSLFVDADAAQLDACAAARAKFVELHTGQYAEAKTEGDRDRELEVLKTGTARAIALGLRVNAGHGLTYRNVYPVACIDGMEELNIGHTIISRAALVGLERAVRDMKRAMGVV
ncbi:Pyridoxine 5'-phosphate synthase [Geitlerinema sp. FC II]|nr:Pyridoxine 5'-phosphate synthase [Geitlerinema sp. FC II]